MEENHEEGERGLMEMEPDLRYGSDYHYIPMTSIQSGEGQEVARDLYCHTVQIANVAFIGDPEGNEWTLVDAGMPHSAESILQAVKERFGSDRPPLSIILTHGHFDHVGSIIELIEHWNVPVFAHEAELPYLVGKQDYPTPDPSAEGGLVAKISPWFPNEAIHLGSRVASLPASGGIPNLPDWKWIHTPGHTPGHVSLFRERDRSLIAGDAFVTVKQESAYKVFTQQKEINGPPGYFTSDWDSARESVKKLEALKADVAITGHGVPMWGNELSAGLNALVRDWDKRHIANRLLH